MSFGGKMERFEDMPSIETSGFILYTEFGKETFISFCLGELKFMTQTFLEKII